MIVLLKIEATLFLLATAVVLFFWLVARGCQHPADGKVRDIAFCLARMGLFSAMMLGLCMIITAIWAFY